MCRDTCSLFPRPSVHAAVSMRPRPPREAFEIRRRMRRHTVWTAPRPMTDPRAPCVLVAMFVTGCADPTVLARPHALAPPAAPSVAPRQLAAEPTIRILIAEGTDALAVVEEELPGELARIGEGESMLAVLTLPLETYLRGVVSAELPAGWNIEVRKAQASAARS